MTILSGGNVGIGESNPNQKLTVNGTISTNSNIRSQDIYLNRGDSNKEGGQINFNRSFDNTTSWGIDIYNDNVGDVNSRLRFIDILSNQERVTILSSGNLGIGTGNPTEKLHVEGNIYANGNISTTGNLYVQGNLSALGDVSIIDTNIISTSSLSVINHGTTEGLLVNQIGNYSIAKFQQDGNDKLVIKGTGTNVTVYNTLTAKDYISSPNINLLQSTSSNWDTTYNTVCTTSSQWMTGGYTTNFNVNKLTVNSTITAGNLKVTNSVYYSVSSFTSINDITLNIGSPTYLFIDANGSNISVNLPDVRPEDVGLVFYIKNNYGGGTLTCDISAKNYGGATEIVLTKKGTVPNYIQFIWDGTQWQQILLG
jgi:hypothetical protein